MVTLAWATERATPARKPVSPARAPLDRSRPGKRHLHRAGGDVDDAAEAPLDHAVDDALDQLDRRGHVGAHAPR